MRLMRRVVERARAALRGMVRIGRPLEDVRWVCGTGRDLHLRLAIREGATVGGGVCLHVFIENKLPNTGGDPYEPYKELV